MADFIWQETRHNSQAPQTEQSKSRSHKPSIGGHKLHLPGHRHNRSHDEKQSGNFGFPLRASTSRDQNPIRSGSTAMSSALNLRSRATSPSPSVQSAQSRENSIAQRSPSGREPKRSLFDRVTGRHKNDKGGPEGRGPARRGWTPPQ
jgi:adenylate cyclase